MIVTLPSLSRRGLTVAAVLATGPLEAVVVPVVTETSVTWSGTSNYEASITYTALDYPAPLAPLDTTVQMTVLGRRYESPGSPPRVRMGPTLPLAGSRDEKLSQINTYIFNTSNPTIGATRTFSLRRNDGSYDPNYPECVGAFLNYDPASSRPLYSSTLAWPTACNGIPAPNQQCAVTAFPGDTHQNLGNVAPGDTLNINVRLTATCDLPGSVTFYSATHTSSGSGNGTMKSVSVQAAGRDAPLPSTLTVPPSSPLDITLRIQIEYTGSGPSTNNVAVVWNPS